MGNAFTLLCAETEEEEDDGDTGPSGAWVVGMEGGYDVPQCRKMCNPEGTYVLIGQISEQHFSLHPCRPVQLRQRAPPLPPRLQDLPGKGLPRMRRRIGGRLRPKRGQPVILFRVRDFPSGRLLPALPAPVRRPSPHLSLRLRVPNLGRLRERFLLLPPRL